MKMITISLAAALIFGGTGAALAEEMVVIVNKANDNAVDKSLIAKIYTGEAKLWAGGGTIVSYDLPEDNPIRAIFCTSTVGKSVGNMKALWAQNLFSGKALPPKGASSDDEVKKAVSGNKNAIGYISASSLDASVKAVFNSK